MDRNTTVRKFQKWYNKFQEEVDHITKGIIKLTIEILKPSDEKKRKVNDMIIVLGGNSTPYLNELEHEYTSKKVTRSNTWALIVYILALVKKLLSKASASERRNFIYIYIYIYIETYLDVIVRLVYSLFGSSSATRQRLTRTAH